MYFFDQKRKHRKSSIQSEICSVSIFIVVNSDNDGDCIIADCKESEDCIIVSDKPSNKRCKLELEENLQHKLIPGDGHCIAKCSAVHFEESLDKVLDKLDTEFQINLQDIDNFLNTAPRKL